MKKIIILILIFSTFSILSTTENYPDFTRHIAKTNSTLQQRGSIYNDLQIARDGISRNMESYDVQYYFIDVEIDFENEYITASVLMRFHIIEDNISQLELNFANTLNVDTIFDNEIELTFMHEDDIITIELTEQMMSGEEGEILITYSGNPVNRLNDGMKFRSHAGTPVVFTMVSPMGARKWWPCKDTPGDKPDSLGIRLTYPEQYISASNGLMISSENNGDGTKTDIWQESFPVATYLTSFAITNYEIFIQNYEYQDQQMEIVHHVYPEQYDVSVELYTPTPQMLDFYASVYGPYPFLTEKYGHASCTDLGALAMEHQTCTSFDAGYITDPEAEYTVAHELAHQWTGDFLTIGNWEHVWLKEGFARYSEALWAEHLFGYEALLDYMNTLDNGSPLDPALQRDPEGSGNDIFNIVIYSKGAWTQHMLRGTVGDEAYFAAVQNLMSDPELIYGNFLTEDLENAAENASGMELDWFFDQWFYQQGRPSYNYTIYNSSESDDVWIAIESLPYQDGTFSMYIPFNYEEQEDRIFVEGGMNHLLLPFSGESHHILLDPDNWVLDYGFSQKLPVLEETEVRNGNVGLAWEEFFDPEIDGFNIYRALPDEAFVRLNNEPLTDNFYFDEDLELGVNYRYKISAVYNGIFESGTSNTIEVEAIDYSFDQGILLVDNSGDFASPFPTDDEIDSFYSYLLEGLSYTEWDVASADYPPLDIIAQYSTLIWHSDDILFTPLIDNFYPLKNYLTAGGRLFLSNCRSLEEMLDLELSDFLAIEGKELNNDADFLGAYGSEDYPNIEIDLDKIPMPTWDDAFANIYKFDVGVSGEMIYSFDSQTDDPEWEDEVCAVKRVEDFKVITLGFPLYFMEENAAFLLMQQALVDLGEITESEENEIAEDIKLDMNIFPNPFNPSTTVSFRLNAEYTEDTELVIYNMKGQKIKGFSISNIQYPISNDQVSINWDGTDTKGNAVTSGLYIVRLNSGQKTAVKKMVLLK
ncbi:M1 family aminopeptidase [Candidatus Cloacimonadota bacterium]